MKATLRLYGFNTPKKVFIWYDFKQVRDAILLLLFAEKTNSYEKVFIYGTASGWETDVLKYYTDEATYEAICKRLKQLLNSFETPTNFKALGGKPQKIIQALQQV